jgi:hypothetical protein
MSAGIRRGLTYLACRALQATLPPSLQSWGWAVRCEAASIQDDTKALLFTLGSLCGLMPRAFASHLPKRLAAPIGDGAKLYEGPIIMAVFDALARRPRALGIACVVGATILGLIYLRFASAPTRYLGINFGALLFGLTMLWMFDRMVAWGRMWASGAIIAMAGGLLATAFLGSDVDGVARWVNLGGLAIQPSLILLPVMIVAFSQGRGALATVGIVAAAVAMALQPDRAMAGMLVLSLLALTVTCRDRYVVAALIASAVGFTVTLARADTLPAAPYVDQIFYSSFDVHAGAGLAVIGGSALLLIPAIVGWHRDANRATSAAFGAIWSAAILAAALGNYPTPIVGYGGSAIIGYALSLLALPKRAGGRVGVAIRSSGATDMALPNRHLLVGLA